jgi:drug/metabolite transporter (DMT)-like permease
VTGLSLVLVLAAAVLHASWNLLAKRAGSAGVGFVWLCAAVASVLYLPLAIGAYVVARPHIGATEVAFLLGSGALHALYFTLLQYGYRVGDLSVVYPLARGTGPMISTVIAIAVLGERPSPLAISGAVLICGGVIVLGRVTSSTSGGDPRAGVIFGVATGVLIATYTLWDRHAVAELAVPALILDWAANAGRAVILAPFARRRSDVGRIWRTYRREVITVAVISPLAYILVLTALAVSPVSYIAPAREVSILIGTMLGVRLLKEGHLGPRLAGAGAIVTGLVALAIG